MVESVNLFRGQKSDRLLHKLSEVRWYLRKHLIFRFLHKASLTSDRK